MDSESVLEVDITVFLLVRVDEHIREEELSLEATFVFRAVQKIFKMCIVIADGRPEVSFIERLALGESKKGRLILRI